MVIALEIDFRQIGKREWEEIMVTNTSSNEEQNQLTDKINTAQYSQTSQGREDIKIPLSLYGAFVDVRNTELTAYWTRYNIQLALNVAVLGLGFAKGNDIPSFIIIGGMCLIPIWMLFIILSKRIISYGWERYILECEGNFPEEFKMFEKVRKGEGSSNFYNLNFIAISIPILFALGWHYLLFLKLGYAWLTWNISNIFSLVWDSFKNFPNPISDLRIFFFLMSDLLIIFLILVLTTEWLKPKKQEDQNNSSRRNSSCSRG